MTICVLGYENSLAAPSVLRIIVKNVITRKLPPPSENPGYIIIFQIKRYHQNDLIIRENVILLNELSN